LTIFGCPRPPLVLPALGMALAAGLAGCSSGGGSGSALPVGSAQTKPDGSSYLADGLDPYGDVRIGTIDLYDGVGTWTSDITELDGARFFKMRFSFINNIVTGLSPELSSVGVAVSE